MPRKYKYSGRMPDSILSFMVPQSGMDISKNMENKTKDYSENPQEIINESFDIIDNLVDFDKIPEASKPIVKRGDPRNRRY